MECSFIMREYIRKRLSALRYQLKFAFVLILWFKTLINIMLPPATLNVQEWNPLRWYNCTLYETVEFGERGKMVVQSFIVSYQLFFIFLDMLQYLNTNFSVQCSTSTPNMPFYSGYNMPDLQNYFPNPGDIIWTNAIILIPMFPHNTAGDFVSNPNVPSLSPQSPTIDGNIRFICPEKPWKWLQSFWIHSMR